VNIHLLLEEKHGVTLAPTAVIQRTTNSIYAYVVKDDHTVTVRQIVPGVAEGDNTEIASGIAPGDVLVMTGVDKLSEGTHVTVQLEGGQAAAKSGGKKK
jgi:multidrug efflux system membrane fusion protein